MTDFDRTIGRLLIGVTYAATALLTVGVALMLASGTSPLSGGPSLDVGSLVGDLASLQPGGFLWLGLLLVMALADYLWEVPTLVRGAWLGLVALAGVAALIAGWKRWIRSYTVHETAADVEHRASEAVSVAAPVEGATDEPTQHTDMPSYRIVGAKFVAA